MKKVYLSILLLLLLMPTLKAQVTATSVWKWVNGDSTLDSHGAYGTKGVANAANKPYSRNGGRYWKDGSGNLWLFGGACPSATGPAILNDLWKYSPSANQWTWMTGDSTPDHFGIYGTRGIAAAANTPGDRTRSANWVDGAGNFWIFGGRGHGASPGIGSSSGFYELSDMWKYNPTTNQWTWMSGDSSTRNPLFPVYGTKGVPNAANNPGGRNNASFWKDAGGNFWIFGGFGSRNGTGVGQLNDLWKYNPTTNEWTWISGDTVQYQFSVYGARGVPAATNKPGARELTVNWTDAAGNFWMFGGNGRVSGPAASVVLQDLWKYDPAVNQWTWVKGDSTGSQPGTYGSRGTAAAANNPGARSGSPSWTDSAGNCWLYGGAGYAASGPSGSLADMWKYDPSANTWTWVTGDSSVNKAGVYGPRGVADTAYRPGGRSGADAWIDGTGNVYLFGGVGYNATGSGFRNDLWKIVPDSIPASAVVGRAAHEAMLYPSPATGKTGLYISLKNSGRIQWQIADNAGKLVVQPQQAEVSGSPLHIDIAGLPTGVYYLQIRGANGLDEQLKFLKL